MRSWQVVIAVLGFWLLAQQGYAKQADYVDVGRSSNQNLGTWAVGDGDQVVTQVFCAASSNYDNPYNDPPPNNSPPAEHMQYTFKVTDLAAPSGYYLYLDGVDTNTGNARIQVQFEHADTLQPVGFETLSDDTYDTHYHLGQFKNCRNGDNSELKMTIPAAQLQQAKAGRYSGSFEMTARGGSSGTALSSNSFSVTINVASAVEISGLAPLALGDWSGNADLTGLTSFCVYSNNATAGYSITISSPNQDAAGNFFLVNPSATVTVPYSLMFAANAAGAGASMVGSTALSGTGNNDLPGCGGVNNASLTATVLSANLTGVTPDTYSDTLTLVVVPQ